MPLHPSKAEIDDNEMTPKQIIEKFMKQPLEYKFINDTLSKREYFAAIANVDADGYSQSYAEQILGEPFPGLTDLKAHLLFWAKFKTYLKVLEADLLIEALNK